VDKMTRAGSTDIGLAINHGMDMLVGSSSENSRFAMILFSDGETDLTYTRTGRTLSDSQADENAAYEKSKELNCHIYPVGISRDGSLNTGYLATIADNTGGKIYDLRSQANAPELFNSLFSDVMGTELSGYDHIQGTGYEQSVTVDIPRLYSGETNILLQSGSALTNLRTDYAYGGASIFHSKNYSGVKVEDPAADQITLYFTTSSGATVKPQAIHYINVLPKVETPENLAAAKIEIEAKLYDTGNNTVITDTAYYSSLSAQCLITNPSTGESSTLVMENTGASFKAIYNNGAAGNQDLLITVAGDGYSGQSPTLSLALTNTPPEQILDPDTMILKQNKELEFRLSDYFTDPDGDSLYYTLTANDEAITAAEIRGGVLAFTPFGQGTDTIRLSVTDKRGGETVGSLTFKVVPLWIYYRAPILGVGCIFILLLAIYLWIMRKAPVNPTEPTEEPIKQGTGFYGARFEGYFLNTKSGNEIPVLHWNASSIKFRKSVTLGDLFFLMDVNEKLAEAGKIYFDAGNNGAVIFHHNTDCVVSLKNKNIPRGKKEVLHYDDKLYIVFEDHTTEIEIRYKRARKAVAA